MHKLQIFVLSYMYVTLSGSAHEKHIHPEAEQSRKQMFTTKAYIEERETQRQSIILIRTVTQRLCLQCQRVQELTPAVKGLG